MINGKMDYNCSHVTDGTPCTKNAGLSKFQFTTGQKHRLRLINAGAIQAIQQFSIDYHKLTIIANDFVPIQPYDIEVNTLGVSQIRTSLISNIHLTSKSDLPAHRHNRRSHRHPNFYQLDAFHHLQLLPHNLTRRPGNNLLHLSPRNCITQHHRLGRHHAPMCQQRSNHHHPPTYPLTPIPDPLTTLALTIDVTVNDTGLFL